MTMIQTTGVSRPLADALAEELLVASRLLADLAFELGSDPETLRRHMSSLQKIDLVTQIQLTVVEMLRLSADCEDAVATVTLEATAARLRSAMTASLECNK